MESNNGEAKIQKVKNWSPVWIFPIVTALIGAWVLFYHYSHQGPEVTLITTNAEGIEGGKTTIKSRSVDVGVVEYCYKDEQKKSKRTQLEIDFVANKGSRRYYIQSALTVADEEKRAQEVNSLNRVGDSFKKIVVVKDNIIPWHDENGILYIGIERFLLEETAMEL